MNFQELTINKIDNGWLVRYVHLTKMPKKRVDEKGEEGIPEYVDTQIHGAVALGTLEKVCQWIETMGNEGRIRKTPETSGSAK